MRSGFLKTGLAAILAGLLLVLPFADLSSMAAQLYAASETTASLSESSSSSVLNESSASIAESSQAQSSVSVSESSTTLTGESSTTTGATSESSSSETAGAVSSTPMSETTSVPATSSSSVVVSDSTSSSGSTSETTSPSSTGSTVPVARMQMALMAVSGDFTYDVTADGVVITGLADGVTITDIVIPAEIDGQKVVAIADKAFMQKGIIRVTVGPNVKTIGEYAFAANQITSLTFDDSLNTPVELKQYAFRDNLLTSVDTKNVTKIGVEAFANNQLTSVSFGNVSEFGTRAFVNNSLIEVSIQSAVTAYGEGVFSYNDRYVLVKTLSTNTLIETERIPDGFGQVVNPVTVTIKHVDKNATTVSLIDDVIWGTDYTDPNGIVVLNTTNTYIPPTIEGYTPLVNPKTYTPNSTSYTFDVEYKKLVPPVISVVSNPSVNQNDLVTEADLLARVKAVDMDGTDISAIITVDPTTISTASAGNQTVTYSVTDKYGQTTILPLIISVDLDRNLQPTGGNWVLGDFIYDANKVIGFSQVKSNKWCKFPSAHVRQ